jgi:hypothetical protein
MARYYVYIKKVSINGIALYVLPKEGGMMADGTFIGEIQADYATEAVDAAWLRLLGKF